MATYFFDVDDGENVSNDEQGTEIDTLAHVRGEAIALLPNIAREELPDGDDRRFSVKVRDDTGRYIFAASLTLHAGWLDGAGPAD